MNGDNLKEHNRKESGEIISHINEINNETLNTKRDGVYLFLSFDLSNATEYKIRNYNNWHETFMSFYREMEKRINDSDSPIRNAKVWKYIGDEILFYLKVTSKHEIFSFLPFVSKIITVVENLLNYNESIYFDKIYIKATIWLADVIDEKTIKNKSENNNNIIFCPNSSSQRLETDFLGSDIDLGFRISKFSHKNIITIDAKLAYLLLHYAVHITDVCNINIDKSLKIFDYQVLKGIWRNHKYPIIWYAQDWTKDIFCYDETHPYNTTTDDMSEKDQKHKTDLLKILKNIFNDINQKKSIDILCKQIADLETDIDIFPVKNTYFNN